MADVKQWITIKGRHIPIFEGESKADAIKRLKEGAKKGKENRPLTEQGRKEVHKQRQAEYDKAKKAEKRAHRKWENSESGDAEEKNWKSVEKARDKKEKASKALDDLMYRRSIEKVKFKKKESNGVAKKEDFVVDYKIPDKVSKDKKLSASAKRKQAIKQMVQKKGIENLGTPKTQEEAKQLLKSNKSAGSDAISKTASRLQKKGFNDPESIEKHLRELSSVRRNRLAQELGVGGRGDEKIKAMTQKIHEAQGGKKAEPAKSWQDKDAETKAKQIANADKQKADAQEAQKPRHYTNMDLEDEEFRSNAKAELKRHQRNWEYYDSKQKRDISPNGYKELEDRIQEIEDYENNLKVDRNKEKVKALRTMGEKAEIRKIVTSEQAFEGKQASWTPKTGDRINNVGHNEAQNKLYDAPAGTTFEMTSRDGDYVGEYTKQSDGSWKGSQKYKSGYKVPTTTYTPKGFAMNVVGKDIKVINDGSERKADWRDVDTKPQKSKKVNLSATYTNAMNSVDTDKVERAIAKLTNNGGSSEQIKDLKEKLRRLRHSEYKEDPAHYNGKGMY